MEGIVSFLKPAGMTSHDAISFFRRLTGIRRIGHTGTLDPMAVGVLPICIGRTTRLIEFLEGDKSYRSIMKLGVRSMTQDIWDPELQKQLENTIWENNIDSDKSFIVEETAVIECLEGFRGEQVQIVPSYSAQKHEGKKLYELARAGQEVPIKEKKVNINNITVKLYNPEKKEVLFDVECSKGTYVRTICADAGEKLGTGAVMSFLLRTEASGLKIENSVTMEELKEEMENTGNINNYLSKPDNLLSVDKIVINSNKAKKFINGLRVEADKDNNINVRNGELYAIFSKEIHGEDQLIGIGIGEKGRIKPKKVIATN